MQRGKINTDIETSESCEKNTFLLKRLSMTSNSPSLQVDFSPIQKQTSTSNLEHPQTTKFDSFPKFHQDACYFTPAFILDIDKEKYISNHQSYLSLHLSKRQELTEQKAELYVPKPSKSNSFCCICKAIFDDYLTHVNIPKHQELMRSSDFAQSIKSLCGKFKKEEVEDKSQVKVAKIKKRIQKNRKKQKEQRCDSMSTKGNIQAFEQIRKQIII